MVENVKDLPNQETLCPKKTDSQKSVTGDLRIGGVEEADDVAALEAEVGHHPPPAQEHQEQAKTQHVCNR
jgi:hypothetical protein